MVKIKVTYNAKPKETKELEASDFNELKKQIYQAFNIEDGKINFMKPRLKDQETFKKDVKEGGQILIVGAKKKDKVLTVEEQDREKKKKEELERMKEQLKLNPHDKIVKRLRDRKIKERGIQYFNPDTNEPQELGVDYALCPLYFLKHAKEFKKYCIQYKCMQKNPDGLIIEEISEMFQDMQKSEGVICPLNWISSWICYCSDDIQYPYPTYGIDYFLNRLFSTMKMAFDVELQKKEEEPNSQVDTGTKCFGVEMLTRRRDITKLDEEDEEEDKEIEKKAIKFFLECDLGKPEIKTVTDGITFRFSKKELWRNFYAFDIQYQETILFIERLPKYLMVHCSQWGYPAAKQEWQEVEFSEGKKCYHPVRLNRVLDLYEMCDANLRDKLDQGRYERDQMFYPYHMDERFPKFQQNVKFSQNLCQNEMNYMYLDHILFSRDIYHQFWFEPLKNSKPTGQFRLVGVILHKGDYYHRPNPDHKHNCKGELQTFMYRRGRDWLRYRKAEVDIVDIQEVTNPQYWGKEGQWTPMLLLYEEINMRNIQVEPPSQTRRDRTRTHRRGGGG